MRKLLFSTALAFISCGIDVENNERENQKGGAPPQNNVGRDDLEKFLFARFASVNTTFRTDSKLDQPLFAGEVNPGDRILIRISGRVLRPRLGRDYTVPVRAQWDVRTCPRIGGCTVEEKTGVCRMKYRQLLGLKESPMEFFEDATPPEMVITIDDNEFRPTKVIHWEPLQMVVAFSVTEEMLANGESGRLFIHPPDRDESLVETVKYGFMGFGHCPGKTAKNAFDFTHYGHEVQTEHPVEQTEYTLDVIIQPDNNNRISH